MSKVKRNGQLWTPEEEKKLIDNLSLGFDFQKLSEIHQRTINAIKLRLLTITEKLYYEECMSINEISEKTKLSKDIIRNHLSEVNNQEIIIVLELKKLYKTIKEIKKNTIEIKDMFEVVEEQDEQSNETDIKQIKLDINEIKLELKNLIKLSNNIPKLNDSKNKKDTSYCFDFVQYISWLTIIIYLIMYFNI